MYTSRYLKAILMPSIIPVLLPWIIGLILLTSESLQSRQPPEKLIIFYGTDHPASIKWFTTDFNKNYEIFFDYLEYEYSPCHNIELSSDGKKMSCDKSNLDCYLDKVHSCALIHIKDNKVLTKFIACSFDHRDNALPQCLSADADLSCTLDKCAKSQEGFDLCVKNYNEKLPISDLPSFGIKQVGYYAIPFELIDSMCHVLKDIGHDRPTSCPSTT